MIWGEYGGQHRASRLADEQEDSGDAQRLSGRGERRPTGASLRGRTGRCPGRPAKHSARAGQFSGLTESSTERPTWGSGGCRLRAGMNLAVLS